jgi:hypothetical protein
MPMDMRESRTWEGSTELKAKSKKTAVTTPRFSRAVATVSPSSGRHPPLISLS